MYVGLMSGAKRERRKMKLRTAEHSNLFRFIPWSSTINYQPILIFFSHYSCNHKPYSTVYHIYFESMIITNDHTPRMCDDLGLLCHPNAVQKQFLIGGWEQAE